MRYLPVVRAYLLVAVLILGCRRKEAVVEQQPTPVPPSFDLVTSDAGAHAELGALTKLAFRITAVHEKQQPQKTPPYHAAGGDWTFFDAVANDNIEFGFGFLVNDPGKKFAFGKAMFTVPDRARGKALVSAIASSFGGAVPKEKPPTELAPAQFAMALLGRDMHVTGGAFEGQGGGWTATKLFLHRDGREGEVFFNFNLAKKVGGFAEKDPEYADQVASFLADELRDGPRPKRTPSTDPNMTAKGPHIEWLRTVKARGYGMDGDRYLLIEPTDGGGERLVSMTLDTDAREEVLRVPHSLGLVQCTSGFCLAQDVRHAVQGQWSTSDPHSVFAIDRAKKTSVELSLENGDFASNAIAPTGAYAVVFTDKPLGDSANARYRIAHVVERDGKVRGPVFLGETWLDLVSVGASSFVLRRGAKAGANEAAAEIDAKSLKVTPVAAPAEDATENKSPSGRRVVTCSDAEIVVRDVATGKTRSFPVHEDDRARISDGCVRFANDRFLEYRGTVFGYIDVETMKLNDAGLDGEVPALQYDKQFKFVVAIGADGVRVGKIVIE